MNGSGITYEDVIAANVRNQKDKEIENLKQEVERLKNINEEHRILNGKLRVENNRLTNITNELEKWVVESIEKYTEDYLDWKYDRNVYLAGSKKLQNVLDKLQELKGSEKE